NWTSNYYYSSHTLPEGAAAFTAIQTVSGVPSASTASWLVTVDLTGPTVTLSVPSSTGSEHPVLTVTASDLNGLASPATVTILVYDSTGTTLLNTNSSAATLVGGQATFPLAYALTVGTTYKIKAKVNDLAGNTGGSSMQTVSVTSASSWSLVGAEQLTSDPINGDALDQLGDVTAEMPLNLDQSGGTQDGGAALVYNSDSAFNNPVIEAVIDTSNSAALPSQITAVLYWDGTPSTGVYSTVGLSPGDEIALNVSLDFQATGTGHDGWSLVISASGASSLGASGTGYMVDQSHSPFGAGWAYGPTDQLVSIPYDSYGPAGMLRVFGTGEWSFYEGTGTFTSPGDDFGTLATSGSGYTYTSPDGEVESYNSAGYETQWTSPDGQETLQYRYGTISGVTVLTGTTAMDGALATFSYGTGVYGPLLSTIQTVNGRTYTFANDGVGLGSVTNPDGQQDVVSGDGYDGHLTYQAWGVETNEFAYNGDSGSVVTATWGDADGSPTAMLPVAVQGRTGVLQAVEAPVLASQTNAEGDVTKWQLDFQGRPLVQYDADGGVYTFLRDATTELVTEEIDPMGRTTQFAYDSSGYVTLETLPDSTTVQSQYQTLDHLVTSATDQLGHTATSSYDSAGHLTSTTDALSNVTAYAYSTSGLETSMTDARGNTTYYAYDSYRRLTATTDALSNTTTQSYDANGFPLTTTDALGHVTTTTYDVMGRLSYWTDPLGGVTSMTYYFDGLHATDQDALGRVNGTLYDAADRGLVEDQFLAEGTAQASDVLYAYDMAGRLDGMRDPTGAWTTYMLDAMGRVTETIDPLGGVTLARYDLDGELTASRDALGNWTDYSYNSVGEMTSTTDPLGGSTATGYDADGDVTSTTDPLSHTTTTNFDADGRVTATTDPLSHTVATTYDADGNVSTVTDANGNVTSYAYDALDRLTKTTVAVGTSAQATSTQAYDKVGDVTSSTDTLGHVTTYKFDADGRQTTMTDPLSHTTTTAYDAVGNATVVTNALNQVTSYMYDALNRQTQTVDALTNVTTVGYDLVGDQVYSIDGLQNESQTVYDALHEPTASIDPLGNTARTAYDGDGDVTKVTDADGNQTQYLYDKLGRQTTVVDPLGSRTTTAYDAAGQVTAVTDPMGDTTQYLFNAAGEQTTVIDALSNRTTTAYDANGNVTAITDSDGNTTQFQFDGQERQTAVIDPLSHRTATTYDAAGNVSTITDADGREQVFHYDSDGQLTAETWLASGATVNLLTYTYDAAGDQLTAADYSGTYTNSYDADDRLTAQTDPLGLTLTYQYDAAGRITQRFDSLGGVLTYQYDNADRLTKEQFGGTGMTQAGVSLAYDAADQLTSVTRYSNAALTTLVGTTVYGYNADGKVTAITNKNASAATLSYYDYTYDAASRVSTQTWSSTTSTGTLSGVYTYSYDADSEVLGDGATTYSFDANGNPTMSGYATGSDNQVTTDGVWTYSYDNVGDIVEKSKGTGLETWYYTYDTLNRLVSIEQTTNGTTPEYTVTYTYDVYGNLMKEQQWQSGGSVTTTYSVYDDGQVWADLNSSLSATTRYISGGPGSLELYARIDVGLGLRQISQDALGSVRDVWDTTGVLDHLNYTVYGLITSETNWTVGGFILYDGLREDRASETVMTPWRTLLTSLQRWLQPDPSGFGGGDGNLYRYCDNNPTNGSDPTGLWDLDDSVMEPVKESHPTAWRWATQGGTRPVVFERMPSMFPGWNAWHKTLDDGSLQLTAWAGLSNEQAVQYLSDQLYDAWSEAHPSEPDYFGGYGFTPFQSVEIAQYDSDNIRVVGAVGDGPDWNDVTDSNAPGQLTVTWTGPTMQACDMAQQQELMRQLKNEADYEDARAQMNDAIWVLLSAGEVEFEETEGPSSLPTGVQANKAAGDAVRDAIAAREGTPYTERPFTTVGGIRRVDVLKLGDKSIGIESKVGRTALDSRTRQELARDWWLRRQGQLDQVMWEFSPSEVTGQVGPTAPLLEKLQKLGFDIRINDP
ncbi:MAG TPA: RHS repeat-associated core domain-containing protein, partial [Gemmataceae bacterium]|nr:RHS repeat-associated core domain-containing protein [Gemmataceae bacterium]